MLFSLVLILAVLAIAMLQATQGLFSALIMAVLTVCCAAAAFGWYEWVAVQWIAPITFVQLSNYAMSISLALLFGVPLLILRLISDRTIRRSGLVASWVDRFGGGLCGLVTGATTMGVAANAILWIPHGTSVLGFARGDFPAKVKVNPDDPDPTPPIVDAPIRELILTPDRFAVGFCAQLSDGVFSGSRSLKGDNPDLVTANAWLNMASSEV